MTIIPMMIAVMLSRSSVEYRGNRDHMKMSAILSRLKVNRSLFSLNALGFGVAVNSECLVYILF